MPLARPPCLTSAYHSPFQKEAPLLEPSRSTGAASHVTQYTNELGFSEVHCKTNWKNTILDCIKSQSCEQSFFKDQAPTWNPACCTAARWNYFATIFSELFVGGRFMASVLAESVGGWLNQRAAKPNGGGDQARAPPRQPRPSHRSLCSSRLCNSNKYILHLDKYILQFGIPKTIWTLEPKCVMGLGLITCIQFWSIPEPPDYLREHPGAEL